MGSTNSKYDEFGNINPNYSAYRGSKAGTEIAVPKSTIGTLPAHAQFADSVPATYKAVPNANTAAVQTFNDTIKAGKPVTTNSSSETPSFFGGLYDSITSGAKNLFSSGPGMYATKNPDGTYKTNDDGTYVNNGTDFKSYATANGLDTSKLSGEDLLAHKQIYAQEQADSGLFGSMGGAQGFADLAGGLGSLASMYYGYESNKRADKIADAQMAEVNRQKQRDVDFANSVNKSGLGAYSAGVK